MPTIALDTKKLDKIVRRNVISVLRDMLTHEDAGLDLTEETVNRLKKSIRSRQAGRVKPLSQILARYH